MHMHPHCVHPQCACTCILSVHAHASSLRACTCLPTACMHMHHHCTYAHATPCVHAHASSLCACTCISLCACTCILTAHMNMHPHCVHAHASPLRACTCILTACMHMHPQSVYMHPHCTQVTKETYKPLASFSLLPLLLAAPPCRPLGRIHRQPTWTNNTSYNKKKRNDTNSPQLSWVAKMTKDVCPPF